MKVAERIPSLATIVQWLRSIFAKAPVAAPVTHAQEAMEPEEASEPGHMDALATDAQADPPKLALVPPVVAPKPKRGKKTQRPADAETFSELLDGLGATFDTLKIPSIKGNWLDNKEVRALHKLGVHVPSPWVMEVVSDPSLPVGTSMPAMASCFMIKRDQEKDMGTTGPRFAFAFRGSRLPASVEQIPGVPYKFGYCVDLCEREGDLDSPPRLFWLWAWVVVKKDGRIAMPHELRPVMHQLNHRRVINGRRQSSYVTRHWTVPSAFDNPDSPLEKDEFQRFMLCVFRQLILWWNRRGDQWSVGVRKDGRRATFVIDPQNTVAYFADRDKTVNKDGKAKKIIHYVREHTRANGSVVKSHVRGLREFDWHGFQCSVTAPRLNGALHTLCDVAPDEVQTESRPDQYLDALQVSARLADIEDFGVLGRNKVRHGVARLH